MQHSHCCQQRWISKERTKERVCASWKLEWMFVVVTGGWLRGRITATTTNPSLCRWSSNHSYQHLRIRENFHHNTLFLLATSFFFQYFTSIVFSDRLLSLDTTTAWNGRPYVPRLERLSLPKLSITPDKSSPVPRLSLSEAIRESSHIWNESWEFSFYARAGSFVFLEFMEKLIIRSIAIVKF